MRETCLKLRIHGRVQGVSYRDWTVKAAKKLGVNGWVRNRADGTVEALVCGEEAAVRQLIEQCYKGALLAKVDKVETSETKETASDGFMRRETV